MFLSFFSTCVSEKSFSHSLIFILLLSVFTQDASPLLPCFLFILSFFSCRHPVSFPRWPSFISSSSSSLFFSCSPCSGSLSCRWPFPKRPFCKAAVSHHRYLLLSDPVAAATHYSSGGTQIIVYCYSNLLILIFWKSHCVASSILLSSLCLWTEDTNPKYYFLSYVQCDTPDLWDLSQVTPLILKWITVII